ncbi:hypothetical protein [uncultured Ruminococcus sp.]|uniref:hypothetical protein n=1 Tax=uncultured Ruminococcus sp. TaxID=165186 RepID=UPI00293051CF|nr:hypothetical protein [uncultured Ruminococcus sp.]
MTFSEQLNGYLRLLDARYSTLAKASGLSVSAVSNYVKGEREPAYNSEQTEKLIRGIMTLSKEREVDLIEEKVRESLQNALRNGVNVEYDVYLSNLSALMKALDIRSSELAKALSFDPSHISKVLSGQRRPGDLGSFTAATAGYLARRCTTPADVRLVAGLIGCEGNELDSARALCDAIIHWLGTNTAVTEDDPLANFLDKMDTFNLDDFIRSIRFDDIRLPSLPFQLPTTKTYTGLREMMNSELDFMKATVLSKSKKDCILYSDMPLEEMAKDPDFPKQYMFGLAMLLKKNLRLNFIHNVNRPFHEMMLGLEGYIPMYMTGQISPYYLPMPQNSVFTHLLKVSGAAALEGTAIAGHQGDGRYVLYKAAEDVRHYRRRAEELLDKARPLMDIYTADRREEYLRALHDSLRKDGDRLITHSSLPLYTMDEATLQKILDSRNLSAEEKEKIVNYSHRSREAAETVVLSNRVTLTVPSLSREAFESTPLNLSLADIFCPSDITYTYEEYQAHLEQTRRFAERFGNLRIVYDPSPTFRNITYKVIGNQMVIISKNKYPTIHFIIHHKRMVQAFRDFIPPLKDNMKD